MQRIIFCLLFLALSFAPTVGWAQASDSPSGGASASQSDAEKLFTEGREAYNEGAYERALALFGLSQKLEPGRGKLINIALCERELGRPVAALRHFKYALLQLDANDSRHTLVQHNISVLESVIPRLQIMLNPGTPQDVVVLLDDNLVGPEPLKNGIPVDPGAHVVIVKAPGFVDRHYEFTIKESTSATLQVEPGDSIQASKRTPKPANPPIESPRRRNATIALGLGGLLGLTVGSTTGVFALVDYGAAEEQCPAHHACLPQAIDRAATGHRLSTASTVAFVAGAVAGGVSLYLYLNKSAPPQASVGINAAPQGMQLSFRTGF